MFKKIIMILVVFVIICNYISATIGHEEQEFYSVCSLKYGGTWDKIGSEWFDKIPLCECKLMEGVCVCWVKEG